MTVFADLDLRRPALRGLLALPTPLLRALAGGGVVCQDGHTLDYRLQFLASQARKTRPIAELAPAEARAAVAAALALVAGRMEPGVRAEPVSIPTDVGAMSARAYRPRQQDPRFPLIVFAHLGGGVVGDLGAGEAFCSMLAQGARCAVLSIDYRLAPEYRFPAGLEDMISAYRWAVENASRFGAAAGKAAVGGDCIGGSLAAGATQEMKRTGERQPALQLLVSPALDLASESRSMTLHAEAFPLSRATLDWFIGYYLRPGDSPADSRLSPLRAANLSALAPAVIVTAGFDPLSDQGAAYARRLRDQGVSVDFKSFDTLAHAFTAFTGAVPAADRACRDIAATVRDAFERQAA